MSPMGDWSWGIIDEFFKRTPQTTKILKSDCIKLSLLNINFSSTLKFELTIAHFFIKRLKQTIQALACVWEPIKN